MKQAEEYPDAKIAVYTCIIPHDYTQLWPPCHVNWNKSAVHYWVISDEPQMILPWWDMVIPPNPLPRREGHKWKMLSHNHLPEYDWVIWVDGNVRLKLDPIDIIAEVEEMGKKVAFGIHPFRDCSYDEGRACAGFPTNSAKIINAQLARYQEDGFPTHYGLAASTFFVRDNRDPEVKKFFELWYNETMRGSQRNQVSWGYAAWRTNLDFIMWDIYWGDNRFWKWTMKK